MSIDTMYQASSLLAKNAHIVGLDSLRNKTNAQCKTKKKSDEQASNNKL